MLFAFTPLFTHALDIVTVNVGESENDHRILFKNELVERALQLTEGRFGPYKIVSNPVRMNISRAFAELEKGEDLSLTFAHTRAEFEEKAEPIRVPIRQGISSYRLLMVSKKKLDEFSQIGSIEDLKRLRIGLSPAWSTYAIMEERGFDIVNATDYESMFRMLEKGRFDVLPRAVNEVYRELDSYEGLDGGLAILPNVALYIPSLSYMFVSRKQPRIYERLNTGLHAMSINGDLSKLTEKHYRKFIDKASMQNRRIITIDHGRLPSFLPHPPILENCDKQN